MGNGESTKYCSDPGVERASTNKPLHVGVVGSGHMAIGIAYAAAERGIRVCLRARSEEGCRKAESGIKLIQVERESRLAEGSGSRSANLPVVYTTEASALRDCDLVIEAIAEEITAKRDVFKLLEEVLPPSTPIASNTSSIPLSRLAEEMNYPERLVGMHFFTPVYLRPLLEIVVSKLTSPAAIARARDVGKRLGKRTITVSDHPGFYTTRILCPFLNESAYILQEGISVDAIDCAIRAFGFPMGPLELSDEVGLDVGLNVTRYLNSAFGERMEPPEVLVACVAENRLGRKTGHGFHVYSSVGRKANTDLEQRIRRKVIPPSLSQQQVQERVVLRMVNEAFHCLGDGTIGSALDGDIGALFGLGFPARLGGPFRYAEQLGLSYIVHSLNRLHAQYGSRFRVAQILLQSAHDSSSVYNRNERLV